MIYNNILDTIDSTHIVKLHRIGSSHVDLYVKVESFNSGGSVKDRLALAIILDAEQKGLLKLGQYRHCAGDGLCSPWLPFCCGDDGNIFD